MKEVKQVIIIRKDLKMRRGKEITQGSHASGNYVQQLYLSGKKDPIVDEWLSQGQKKITMVVNSEKELFEVYQAAIKTGLNACIITDAGHTDAGSGKGVQTKTAISIGPDYVENIDKITGKDGSHPGTLY